VEVKDGKGNNGDFTFEVTPTQPGALVLEASESPDTAGKVAQR